MKTKTVWLVDDDEEMIIATRLMFKMLGYELRGFLDARKAARALLDEKRPDLVIIDINMPEVTGFDLLEFIRRRASWKRLPVIVFTADASDISIDKAHELGADGYICKPATLDEIQKTVEAAIQRRSTNRGE